MASLSSRRLKCKDLHAYLRSLTTSVLDKLYNHPATCLAVFRDLPELGRHFVMRLLFVDQPVAQAVVAQWITRGAEELHQVISALSELRVWHAQVVAGGLPGWILNPVFRENMKTALLGGNFASVNCMPDSKKSADAYMFIGPVLGLLVQLLWAGGVPQTSDKHSRDIPFLDKYALERWECVLHFMVGSTEGSDGVNREINDVLVNSGLMAREEGETLPTITPEGFQFLLMDTASQVWYFLLEYLDTIQSRGLDLVSCLSFLFQLSFSTLGKDYSTEGMSESQLRFLQHLREFGLVYQRKRKSQRYYPTRLAINIASGLKSATSNTHRPGFLVVETNYRVYAYTDSTLQEALLALFCEPLYRFPNMVVFNLTRDSVRAALARGITAEQILNYLRSHAHPEMMQKNPVIPPTITDQIRLWELERSRLTFTEGVMYNQFLSQADFEVLRDYAKEMDVLVWELPEKRVMVVTKDGHDDVKRFWKRQRQS